MNGNLICLREVEIAYMNDVAYHGMVDMMVHFLEEMQLTPSELRSAANLASIIFEQQRKKFEILNER